MMEQEQLGPILDELNSITQSPYPVSLKRLEILSGQSDDAAFRLWVDNYPCRASVLAQKACDGLKYSASAVFILEKLSRLGTFRSIILEQNSSILSLFIRRALDADTHTEQYSEICANFLSSSLVGIPLPIATEHFVSKISDSAVRNPSIRNIAQLHRVVKGSCRELLVALPPQALQCVIERVIGIIKATKATDENSPILFCISILACLQQQCINNSVYSGILHHVAGEFFHGQKSTKTIQLILLRTIWACKDSTVCPLEGTVGCLRLARAILEIIDTDTLSTWRHDHSPIVCKLVEKLSGRYLDTDVLCEGAALLSIVFGGRSVPANVIRNLGESILKPKLRGILDEDGYSTLNQVICNFIHILDHDFHVGLLEKTFHFALESTTRNLYQFKYLLFLLEAVESSMQEDVAIASNVQKALTTQRLSSLLNRLLNEETEAHKGIDSHTDKFCLRAFENYQQRLRLAIISLSLKSSLLIDNPSSKLPVSTAQRLVEKQVKIKIPLLQCEELLNHRDSNSLNIAKLDSSNPYASFQGYNWKEQLAEYLKSKAVEQAQHTVEAVERICEDFERRCESIEEPLREKQQKLSEAQHLVRRLEEQVKNLGTEADDRVLYLDGLEAEKAELEVRLKEVDVQNSALTGQNDELRRLLKEATDNKSRTLSSLRSEREALEFQYKTKITTSEAEIERLQSDLNIEKSYNIELKTQVEAGDTNKTFLQKNLESLRAKISCYEEESKALVKKVLEKEESLSDAEKAGKRLEEALKIASTNLDNANEQNKRDACKTSLSIESLKTDLEHADNMKKTIQRDLDHSRQQLQKLENERNNALITVRDQETKIQKYEEMNENLFEELQVKDSELAEGQELRAKLFALVGGKQLDLSPLEQPEKSLRRRALPTRTRSDVLTDQTSISKDLLHSFGSSGSSSRKSPTPKRMRKVFKVPTMKHPQFSPNKYSSRSKRNRRSETSRTPLSNASPGRYNLISQPTDSRSPQEKSNLLNNPFSPIRTTGNLSVAPKLNKTATDVNKAEVDNEFHLHPSRNGSTMNRPINPQSQPAEDDDTTLNYLIV